MDTITHAMTGLALGYCGFRQRAGRAALWACVIGAEFPDADAVLLAVNSETYLRWHRSFTHSALLLPLWAALVAWTFWEFSGRKNFRWLWGAAAAGIGSHLVLDWFTSYGTMLLWPLTDQRFALSWLFILDPYVWALLAVTLWAVWRRESRRAAPIGLAIFAAYAISCGLARFWVTGVAEFHANNGRVSAYAQPLRPWRWTIVRAEGETTIWRGRGRDEMFEQFADDKLRPQAEATSAVRLFRWFAAFPVVEKLEARGHTVLRYRDLRFRTPLPWGELREGMFVTAEVEFDEQGRVLAAEVTKAE